MNHACLSFRYREQSKRHSLLACVDCGREVRSSPTVWAWVALSFGKWRRRA